MWEPFSTCSRSKYCESFGVAVETPDLPTKRDHNRQPRPYERFIRAVQPTPNEVAIMLVDLKRTLGDWNQIELVTGIPLKSACEWIWGRKRPSASSTKVIFLFWSLICRPGELETLFDLSTCGRFTKRGDPATAGGKLKRNLTRNLERVEKSSHEIDD